MRKVLIITYYWPPSGGSGVQRWLKFAKYLPEFNYTPVILTPENPSFINTDDSLLDEADAIEVLKLPIWEPYQVLHKLKGKKGHQKDVNLSARQSAFEKLVIWVRGNILLPDPRRFWIRPAYRFLRDYLKDSDIDLIVTTGPPHSIHLIGLKLKRKLGLPWLADFRDPWSEWDLLDNFRLSSMAKRTHRRWERAVLSEADHVVSVGWEMGKDMVRLGASKHTVITNGFDPSDFAGSGSGAKKSQKFTIRHIGSIDELRDPRPFVFAVQELVEQGKIPSIQLEFIGNVTPSVMSDLKRKPYSNFVNFREYIAHDEVIPLFAETDVLLLVLAHSKSSRLNITGKIFEYVASGCPIFGIGDPEGDAARVVRESGRGVVIGREDHDGIKSALIEMIKSPPKQLIDLTQSPYSRHNLTKKLSELFDSMLA